MEPKKLVAWQEREISIVQANKRFGIVWDMGLGKTGGSTTLGTRIGANKWIILCPRNAFETWSKESNKWILSEKPDAKIRDIVIDKLSPAERDKIWTIKAKEDEIVKIICTPDTFMRDWGVSVAVVGKKKKKVEFKPRKDFQVPQIMIIDEFKRFRNPDSIGFRILSKFVNHYNIPYVLPMTGTPGHQPKHFYSMLNLIAPRVFGSYWRFVNSFHHVDDGFWGKEVGEPKNLQAFREVLNRYVSVIREDSPEVADSRPAITRQLLTVDLSKDQKRIYKQLSKEMLAFANEAEGSGLIIAPNELTLMTRLRQLLICPKILDESLDYGGAIEDFVETWDPEDGNTVIFTPFTRAIPHFNNYLRSKGYKYVYHLHGGISQADHTNAIESYRANRGIMLCSILYATAFSLQPATKCFFIGYDWDPDNNRQAEKRLQRGLTSDRIAAYYYTYESTFDRNMAEIVNIKQSHMNLTIPSNLRQLFDQKIIESDQNLTD